MDSSLQVAPSRHYGWAPLEKARLLPEWLEATRAPGRAINTFSQRDYDAWRDKADLQARPQGLAADGKSADVPNPDAADGRWDPYAFLPRFCFEPGEDAYPLDPAFDRNSTLGDNVSHYKDGSVGGKQPLNGFFAVSRKGPYTVLTYSFYYAHNKAGAYHKNDYSTAQVYLKDGKPAYLYTSWHRGGRLTRWADLQKDGDGRPVILVGKGTHALRALGRGDRLPTEGFQLAGNGQASLNGVPLPARITFDALQGNVAGARVLDPASKAGKARIKMLGWGQAVLNPFLPSSFKGESPWKELGHKLLAPARWVKRKLF